MSDVRYQHRGLQRFLTAMALAAILETFNLQTVAADQPAQTKSKSTVVSGNRSSGENSSDDQSDAGWRSRRAAGKWTAGTKTPEKASSTAAKKNTKPSPTVKNTTPSTTSTARRSPSLVFIAGKSAADEHKPDPAETVPQHDAHDHPPAAMTVEPKPLHQDEHLEHSDDHAASDAAAAHAPSDGDGHEAAHPSNDVIHHDGKDGTEPHASEDQNDPKYFHSAPETMPGLSPEDSLDDQPVMSTTERLKQLLMDNERRQNGEAAVEENPQQHQPAPLEGSFRSFGTVPSLEEDLNSSDPARRQRAQRILRIRQQILHLKAQAKKAESIKSEPLAHGHSAKDGDAPAGHAAPQHAEPHADDPQPHSSDGHNTKQHPAASNDHHPAADNHEPDSHTGHDAPKSSAHHEDAGTAHDDHSSPQSHSADAHASDHHASEHHEGPASDHSDAGHGDEHGVAGAEATGQVAEHGSSDAAHGMIAIGEPIDRVGLANNLYALGEYPAAHDAYLAVELEQLTPEQQFWVEYQIANCLRRVGESAAASNQFRKLAAQPEAGWISEQAAWWVDILEQIRQAEKALQDEDPTSAPAVPQKKLPLSGISTEASHGGNKH